MAGREAVTVAGDPVSAASVADGFLRRRRPRAVSQPREHLIGERTRGRTRRDFSAMIGAAAVAGHGTSPPSAAERCRARHVSRFDDETHGGCRRGAWDAGRRVFWKVQALILSPI